MARAQIRRIRKIGNFRTFRDWTDEGRPVEFRRVNLIYGTNGSGKSTLADLFRSCSIPDIKTPSAGLVLDVDNAGTRLTISETDPGFWPRVRVFNSDYVRENLHFDDEAGPSSDSVLTLGKPNVDAERELKRAQSHVAQLMPTLQPAQFAATTAEKQLQDSLSKTAAGIVDDLRDSSVATYRATNTYTRANVRKLLDGDPAVFDGASVDTAADRAWAISRAMDSFTLRGRGPMADGAALAALRNTLQTAVAVAVIETLRGHEDRARWVQEGIALHDDLEYCLFCGQLLTVSRRNELEAHFADELTRLQGLLDFSLKTLRESCENSTAFLDQVPRDGELYPELAGELREARSSYKSSHDDYLKDAEVLRLALESKRNNPFQTPTLAESLTLIPPTTAAIEAVIAKHQLRRESHAGEAAKAARRVELARVSLLRLEYSERLRDVEEKRDVANGIDTELRSLREQIIALQNVSADPIPKADELTRNVERLLGRSELRFTTSEDGSHYSIERHSQPATHLSEGERTAIALLHFLASIRQEVVVGDEPVVVIDDPVSSLDESILFGVSSFLWSELVGNSYVSQVFLLTHNFELFRQWLIQLESAKRHIDGGFTIHELRGRYKVIRQGALRRSPQFDPWTEDERQSRRLRSLYHFLFAKVATAVIESTPALSLAERMDLLALAPNAARKMMESFLSFRYPAFIGDFHGGMRESLKGVSDQSVRTHVERYVHAYSHNEQGDISAVVDPSEATVVLRSLFQMMKEVDGMHFSAMCEALLINEKELLSVPVGSPGTGAADS